MKKGVSLVTVLLFMMVATIAATATYKWVSSVNSSSAARLQVNEARQAALSGIEAARSWMTFNGNDLGAVIRQYFENEKKPILLNSVLPRMGSAKMRDSVWLMGVNVENSSRYKIKIVSLGTTRENVKYSEVAIFNVNGLYQIEIPTEERTVDYKDAFHGGLATADVIEVSSAFIKQTPAVAGAGGQALNRINVSEYLVLDGNFYVNNNGDVKDLYVTGDLSFGNNLNVSGDLYIGGTLYGTASSNRMSVSGSTYLNGGMKVNNLSTYAQNLPGGAPAVVGGKFDFYGDVTSNGNIDHFSGNTGISYIKMHENLVLNGKINFPSSTTAKTDSIEVLHNAFIRDNSTTSGNIGSNFVSKTRFGVSPDDKLYLASFQNISDGNVCGGAMFKCAKSTNGNIYVAYKGSLISMPLEDEYKDWNADSLVVYRNMISSERYPECGYSKDRIQFNTGILNSDFVHSANSRFGCSEDIWKNDIEFPVQALNTCYNTANTDDQLLDNTWLVVKWDHAPKWRSTEDKLSGNFIFIINSSSAPQAELELPETDHSANVMIYLPDGWKNASSETALKTNQNKANAVYNYFIYSVDDIGRFDTRAGTPVLGSVYMQGCSQLNSLAGNNTLAVSFNPTLFKALVKSSVLCEFDGTNMCTAFSGTVGIAGLDPFQTVDPYHISTSPQLIVEVESQYRNKEPLPQGIQAYQTVTPSEIVLPRVIYLPRDAYGHLSDYYNVIGLNGSKAKKVASKMTCPNEIPTGDSKLSALPEGRYMCSYGDDAGGYVPVYVVVEGSLGENSEVKFHPDDENKEISTGNSVDVRLSTTSSATAIDLDIMVPDHLLSGWTVEPIHPNLTLTSVDNGWKIYTLHTIPTGDDIPVFRVSTSEDAELGGVDMHLKVCNNCIIRSPTQSYVYISNRVQVVREEVNCSQLSEGERGDFVQAYGIECTDIYNIPSCGSLFNDEKDTWVTARGSGCFPLEKNNKWNCYTGGTQVNLERMLPLNHLCEAYIPPKFLELKSHKGDYRLPASLKRKRDTLVVKIEGPNKNTGIKVNYQRLMDGYVHSDDMSCSGNICTFATELYAGDTVYLSKDGGSGRFSYWMCNGPSCGDRKPEDQFDVMPFKMILQGGKDSVTAWFGQKDAHCFYTNFEDFKSSGWCTATDIENDVHCIDYCKSGSTHCAVGQTPYEGRTEDADWLMVYSNNGSSFKFPQIGSGRIKHPEGFGKRVIAQEVTGKPSVFLSRVVAGSNGMMTAMMMIPSATSEFFDRIAELFNFGQLLIDDGLVIRSNANASEYFTMNIITHETIAYARLCYVTDQYNNYSKCYDKKIKSGPYEDWSATASRLKRLTLNLDVNGDKIRLILSKNNLNGGNESGMAVTEFDLSSQELKNAFGTKNGKAITLNDEAHQYVGFKIGYPYKFVIETLLLHITLFEYTFTSYELYDIGWRSYDYDENCWDTPKVSCSFKANYTGGMVPDSMDVTPWVGMSSWFEGKNCKVTYYYNGCDLDDNHLLDHYKILKQWQIADNPNDFVCRYVRPRGKGLYAYSARELETYKRGRLRSENYWFEDEGYHGYPIETPRARGTVNEASVIVSCERNDDNDNAHIYDASCGDFIVGEYKQCDESYSEMLSFPQNCYATDGSCFVELDTIFNVREAHITFTLEDAPQTVIKPYLVDIDSNISELNVEKVSDTEYRIDVEAVSDAPGFNPQNLRGILFKNVSHVFTVNHVQSKCRYAFSLECKDGSYSFLTKRWTVSASVVHPERAETCEIIPLEDGFEIHSADVPEPQACGEDFVQFYDQDNVYGQFVQRNYAFKVVAKDVHGDVLDECETPVKTFDPFEVHCSLSADTVEQGFGIPLLRFSIDNCPPQGCPYTITYPAEFGLDPEEGWLIPGDQYQNCPGGSCTSINTEQNKLSKGDYEYQVDVMGHTCPVDSNKFYIAPEPEKGTCSDPRIEIDEDGKEYFAASIAFGEGGYWKGSIAGSARIVYTDYLGNVFEVDNKKISTADSVFFNENIKQTVTEFKYELPKGMFQCNTGVCNFLVSLLLYGGDYCTKEWKVRAVSNFNSSCPSIQNQNASSMVNFQPVIGGCEDNACKWSVKRNEVTIAEGSSYDGSSLLTFSDAGAAGTKTYTFAVTADDEFSQSLFNCDFNVTYTNDGLSVENCGFTNTTEWGGIAKYTFRTNCAGCSYDLRSPTGVGYSGTTNSLENDATDVEFTISKAETFNLTVNGKAIEECADKIPVMGTIPASCDIGNSATKLYSDQKAMFTATFGACSDGSCKWPWVLKKNNGEIFSGEVQSNGTIQKEITGGGTYALFLNGSDAAACTIEITDEGPTPSGIGSCRFEKDEYSNNEGYVKFIATGVSAMNESWTIKKGNTVFASGSGLNKLDEEFSTYGSNNFKATSATAGTYVFTLNNSGKTCSADLNVKKKSINSCTKKDRKLYVQTTGCSDGCKTYYKRTDRNSAEGSVTITSYKEISVERSDKKYTVYFDGEPSSAVNCVSGNAPQTSTIKCSLSGSYGYYTVTATATNCNSGCHYILYRGNERPSDYDDPNAYPEIISEGTISWNSVSVKNVGDKWFRVTLVENGSEIAVGTCK